MQKRHILTAGTAALASAVSLALAPAALAGGTLAKVSVRVEGKTRTLLPAELVRAGRKPVRRAGHSCAGNSGMGAFNKAVRGRWSGTWFSGLGFDVTKILGETDDYTRTGTYWALYVNDQVSSVGICGLKLKAGERILFAAVPDKGTVYPTQISSSSRTVRVGTVVVHVVYYDAKGITHPLSGATVSGGKLPARTNAKGNAVVVVTRTGRLTLTASRTAAGGTGYIRSELTLAVRS